MTGLIRSSLLSSAVLTALAVSACGASDRQTPTLQLPLTAPEGAEDIVADFIEICSLSLTNQPAAITMSNTRGWVAVTDSGSDQIAAVGGFVSENIDGASLNIFPITFPHFSGTSCFVNSTYFEDLPDFSVLADIPGLLGDIQSFGDGDDTNQIGRFSGIGPDGYPLSIQLNTNADYFFNLIMTTTRPETPSGPNQE